MAIDIEKLAQVGSMAAGGGYAQAAMGGVQALYGLSQLPKAKAEFERAKAAAPSLETPAQFYENYKNAYDGEMARMQNDAIQSNLATSVQALQGAGGRALIGGLNQATAQSQMAQNSMLAQERQMRLAAGQQLATAEERAVGRKEGRSQQEMAYANQAYQSALGNIGSGLGSVGEGLMYGMSANKGSKTSEAAAGTEAPVTGGEAGINTSGTAIIQRELENSPEMNDIQLSEEEEVFENFLNEDEIDANRIKEIVPQEKIPLPGPMTDAQVSFQQKTNTPAKGIPSIYSGMAGYQGQGTLNVKPQQPGAPNMYPFGDLSPENKMSPVPAEYRNDQAMKQIQALGKSVQQFAPMIGRMTSFRHGGMVTGGEFNHDSNPIDLIQGGQKIGEATGGEYILNPDQAAAISRQSAFAKNLFKKFEKNAKKKK